MAKRSVDTSKTGKGRASRESHMRDIPKPMKTLGDQKRMLQKAGMSHFGETRGAQDSKAAGDR